MRLPVDRSVLSCAFLSLGIPLVSVVSAQSPAHLPAIAKSLAPPKEQAVLLHLSGKGDQIYSCTESVGVYAWKLKAPEAKLYSENAELAGRHFAGPTWEANDGSRVTGKLVASVPSPDATSIPWLLLTAVSHQGSGAMASVQSIQRLKTKGGVAPHSSCGTQNGGEEMRVPYEADYYFYGTPTVARSDQWAEPVPLYSRRTNR